MMRLTAAYCLGLLVLGSCGGSSGETDAAPDALLIDAAPVEQLNVTLDEAAVCPNGWTTGPTATEDEARNRVAITASCADGSDEVLLYFTPRPENPGDTASCYQSTVRVSDNSPVNCRVGSAQLKAPSGELTLSTTAPLHVSGACECVGEGGETASATFNLSYE
jgi:hypothetical protein